MMAADTYFAEDFQLLNLGNTQAPIGEYDTSVAKFKPSGSGTVVKIETDAQRYLGHQGNKRLRLEGTSGSSKVPRAYFRSGENAVQDTGRFQFEYRKDPGAILRVTLGEANSDGANSLSNGNSIIKVDFRHDQRVRIYLPGNASILSSTSQTDLFEDNKTHVVWFDFNPGTSGTRKFSMYVDGVLVKGSNGQDNFDLYNKKGTINAMQLEGRAGNTNSVYIDNLVLHNNTGAKNFFVDVDHPNAWDAGGRDAAIQGKSADKPFETVDYALKQLEKGDTLFIDGTKFNGGGIGNVYRTDVDGNGPKAKSGTLRTSISGSKYKPIRIKGWRGVPTIDSMYQPSSQEWVQVSTSPNVWYFQSASTTEKFKNVSRIDGSVQIPMTLMVPTNQTTKNDRDGKVQHLRGNWQWTRTFEDNSVKSRVYVRLPGGAKPTGSGSQIQISSSSATFDVVNNQHHIHLEDFAVRGGYYGIRTTGDYTFIKRVKVDNTFADGIKGNVKDFGEGGSNSNNDANINAAQNQSNNGIRSDHGLIINSVVSHFGESGVDITGGSFWTLYKNRISNDINNRLGPGVHGTSESEIEDIIDDFPIRGSSTRDTAKGSQGNGIMIKGGGRDIFVIQNTLQDFKDARLGVIIAGGSTGADNGYETIRLRLKGNIIKNVKNGNSGKPGGAYAISVTDSYAASISNNRVEDSIFLQSIVQFKDGDVPPGNVPAAATNSLTDNKFFNGVEIRNADGSVRPTGQRYVYRESGTDGLIRTKFEDNDVPTGRRYFAGGSSRTFSQFKTYAGATSGLTFNDSELLEVSGSEIVSSTSPTLTDEQLQRAVGEAIYRWQSTGIDTSALEGVSVTVDTLDSTLLGVASGTAVVIDSNAAGHGWYLDDDYSTDSEFQGDGPAGVDLLTTVMHELGHVLGLEHTGRHGDLMGETLGDAERFNPDHYGSPPLGSEVAGVAPNSLTAAAVDGLIQSATEDFAQSVLTDLHDDLPLQPGSYRIEKPKKRLSRQPANVKIAEEADRSQLEDLLSTDSWVGKIHKTF